MTQTSTGAPYRRYRRPRRRWPYLLAAAVCVGLAVVAWQLILVPRVSAVAPQPDAYVNSQHPTVRLRVRNLEHLSDMLVLFEGHDVTAETKLRGDELVYAPGQLADGSYDVRFSARSSNLFKRRVIEHWTFTVDTTEPELDVAALRADGRITTDPAVFSGTTEPSAEVSALVAGENTSTVADSTGRYRIEMRLAEGPTAVTLKATDLAGNTTSQTVSLYVDASPPILEVAQLDRVIKHSGLRLRISGKDVGRAPQLEATIDGDEVELKGTASSARLVVRNLAQGRHALVVTATDKGGNETKDTQVFVVDSTEKFGVATIMKGARGKDVRELQRRLAAAGVFDGERTGQFGKKTEEAVRSFQEKFGLTIDGIVGTRVLTALSGNIVVDLSELRLYFYRDDHLVKSYRIAAGTSQYPTPTGTYSVVSKVIDPTWYPPNSEWAKDAKPIPPGITNPLGTRWIGTSAPNVGIHGTPDDGSVGTYASHGCIRMHIWEVEELFERVAVGMPVIIRQ
jgi:lipoprotein-anchoring transpeptidase ErfK/SrfK